MKGAEGDIGRGLRYRLQGDCSYRGGGIKMSDVRVSHYCVPVPVTSRCSLSLGSSVPASLTAGARPGVPSLCSHWRLSVQAPGVTEADPERR